MKSEEKTEKSQTGTAAEWLELEKKLHSVAREQKPVRLKIFTEIFKVVVRLAQESPGTLNLKIVATVLKELRFSFRMFYPYRTLPKITMFGSARVPSGTPLYELAKKFATDSVERKYMVITGGGPGIMAAGNEGATLLGGFGLNIRLPFEQSANTFIDSNKMLINYKYFFTRKLFLVKEASAFAFFPGGVGTFDEAFEVLTLLQTGKMNPIPVVLVEPPGFGFWTEVLRFMNDVMLKKGFISKEDAYLYKIFHTSEEALNHIDFFYRNYHSLRYVKNNLVIRLKFPVSEAMLRNMNQHFPGLTQHGKITVTAALPEEANEPELMHLPRICFPFDRRDFGSLRRLIDFLNEQAV